MEELLLRMLRTFARLQFADNMIVYGEILSGQDCLILQSALQYVGALCQTNEMVINEWPQSAAWFLTQEGNMLLFSTIFWKGPW